MTTHQQLSDRLWSLANDVRDEAYRYCISEPERARLYTGIAISLGALRDEMDGMEKGKETTKP